MNYLAKCPHTAHHKSLHHLFDSMQVKTRKDNEKIYHRQEISEKEEYEKAKWREYNRSYVQAVIACVWFYSPVSKKIKREHVGYAATGHGTESFFMARDANP